METLIRIPTLETERLVLRAPQASDLDAYAEFCASPRSVGVGGPYDRDQAFTRLSALLGHWHLRGYGRWMVTDRATGAPMGIVGLMYPESWPAPEIAWSLFDAAEGKSIAFEAAMAARDFAYRILHWDTVISCVVDGNDRSNALAQRMGCTKDGVFQHPQFGPLIVWRHRPANEVLQ